MNCPNCGKDIKDDEPTCTECGYRLEGNELVDKDEVNINDNNKVIADNSDCVTEDTNKSDVDTADNASVDDDKSDVDRLNAVIDGTYIDSVEDDMNDVDDYAGYVDETAQYVTKKRSGYADETSASVHWKISFSDSSKVYIAAIAGIIAVVLIICAFAQGKNEDTAVVDTTTTEITTAAKAEKKAADSVVSGAADIEITSPTVVDDTNYISTYAKIIRASYSANEGSLYYLFDMNGDSLYELIVYYGDTVSGSSYDIYTVSGDKIILCSTLDAGYGSIYSDGSNIYIKHSYSGTEQVIQATLAGTTVTENTVYKGSNGGASGIGSIVVGTSTSNLQPLYSLS
jgi:hypothetical protein